MFDYVVTSPVYNEIAHLPELLEGLAKQTNPPLLWLVVDDGSEDGSREWLEAAALEHPWLLVRDAPEKAEEYLGAHIARIKRWGLVQVLEEAERRALAPTMVGVLDADVRLPPDHYERLAQAFEADPALGVTSSLLLTNEGNTDVREPFQSRGLPRGPTQTFRLRCLEDIGGLPPYPGFDGAANVKAQQRGWKTEIPEGVFAMHSRPTATRFGEAPGFSRKGEYAWFLGVHPLLVAMRAAAYTQSAPHVAGLHFAKGWLSAAVRRQPRCPDPEIRRGYGWRRLIATATRRIKYKFDR